MLIAELEKGIKITRKLEERLMLEASPCATHWRRVQASAGHRCCSDVCDGSAGYTPAGAASLHRTPHNNSQLRQREPQLTQLSASTRRKERWLTHTRTEST